MELPEEVTAPVCAGDRVGTLTVSRDGAEALAIPIVAGETVERLTWGQTVTQMLRMAIFCQ